MSDEGREQLVTRVFDALNQRDWDELRGLVPPDVEFRSTFEALEGGGIYHGVDEFLSLMESLFDVWDETQWHLDSVRDAGARSVVLYRVSGVAKGSGVPLDQALAMVWTWRDGSLVRAVTFSDQREALEAAGLSE